MTKRDTRTAAKRSHPLLGGKGYLTVAELMALVGMSRTTVYRWMDEGRLPEPHAYVGPSPRWDKAKLKAWIQAGKCDGRRSA